MITRATTDTSPSPFTPIQEYQENNSNIILENVEINQVVNIYGCKNSVIQVKGKVNAINLSKSG